MHDRAPLEPPEAESLAGNAEPECLVNPATESPEPYRRKSRRNVHALELSIDLLAMSIIRSDAEGDGDAKTPAIVWDHV